MSSISCKSKYCCTCEHFGGDSKRNHTMIVWTSPTHVCKIKARGNGNQGAMNSACSKWEEKK